MGIDKLHRLTNSKRSRIILALDFNIPRTEDILSLVENKVVGLKIGLPFILSEGLSSTKNLLEKWSEKFYFIADFKLADIPEIMAEELKLISDIGFDAAIIHLFQGGVSRALTGLRLDIIGIAMMSHPESIRFEPLFDDLIAEAVFSGAVGVVIGASKTGYIRRTRKIAGRSLLIFSPGIGVQGAPYGSAISAGADYEIIGRSITLSSNPGEEARKAAEAGWSNG